MPKYICKIFWYMQTSQHDFAKKIELFFLVSRFQNPSVSSMSWFVPDFVGDTQIPANL